jgi:hypothetical protein
LAKKNDLKAVKAKPLAKCRYCGKDINCYANRKYYCNSRCMSNHKKNIPLSKQHVTYCNCCNKAFEQKNQIARYCSLECVRIMQKRARGYKV